MGTRRFSIRAVDVVAGIMWTLMVVLWLGSRFVNLDGYLGDGAVIALMVAGVLTIRAGMTSVRDAVIEELQRPDKERALLLEAMDRR